MIKLVTQPRIVTALAANATPPNATPHTRSRLRASVVGLSVLTTLSTTLATTLCALSLIAVSPRMLPPAVAQSYPTLSPGSEGETVSQLQATLKLLGFYGGDITGSYDQPTANAVAQFQSAAGIAADGVAGPSTWQKLLPTPDGVTATSQAATPVATNQAPAVAEPASTEAAPKAPLGPPVLRAESEGPAVAQLQRELQTLGYYEGTIDGGFGEQTKAAVESFQSDQQLFVDGVVGAATWDALSRELDRL